jgi:hypothetical protein
MLTGAPKRSEAASPMKALFPTVPVISAEFTIHGETFRASSAGSIDFLLPGIFNFLSTRSLALILKR